MGTYTRHVQIRQNDSGNERRGGQRVEGVLGEEQLCIATRQEDTSAFFFRGIHMIPGGHQIYAWPCHFYCGGSLPRWS